MHIFLWHLILNNFKTNFIEEVIKLKISNLRYNSVDFEWFSFANLVRKLLA